MQLAIKEMCLCCLNCEIKLHKNKYVLKICMPVDSTEKQHAKGKTFADIKHPECEWWCTSFLSILYSNFSYKSEYDVQVDPYLIYLGN